MPADPVRFELSGYRVLRGSIIGTVKALAGDTFLYADGVNLSTGKSREGFIKSVSERMNGAKPDGFAADAEQQLLRLLEQAEAALHVDPAPGAPTAADDEVRLEDYALRAGRYEAVRVKETQAGPIETRIPLSNFVAAITDDVLVDDGTAETVRYYLINGRWEGRTLPVAKVLARDFDRLAWVSELWGVGPRVLPGLNRKDLLRDCILAFSRDARRRSVYAHTGWRRLGAHWVFLHAGGAISARGPESEVEVELPPSLGRYALPDPPAGDDLIRAVRASWDVWDLAQPEAAAALLGAQYGAPLSELWVPDFSLWCYGPTGRYKTSYAALVLCHSGQFDAKNTPANWEGTANFLERLSFQAKDLPLLMDDYRPAADRLESSEMRRKAARLLRAGGNRSGRGRMRSDTSLRPDYAPRGILVITGEELPPGESTVARAWVITFTDGTVDRDRLTAAQEEAPLLARAMAEYIRWLAGQMDQSAERLRDVHREALRQARQDDVPVGGHRRHPGTLAYLLASWALFAEFAQGCGAVTGEEAADRMAQVARALRNVAEQQAGLGRAAQPANVYVDTLGDLLAGGKAYVAAVDGTAPAGEETSWGWRRLASNSVEGGEYFAPQGDKLGWVDEDENSLYLIPAQAHRLVARTVGEMGGTFAISDRALRDALGRAGFLLPGNKEGGKRHNAWAEGGSHNVLRLDLGRVRTAWGDAQ